ncbi:hypothetical protein A3Q56_00001, partial [Intoshia linei]
ISPGLNLKNISTINMILSYIEYGQSVDALLNLHDKICHLAPNRYYKTLLNIYKKQSAIINMDYLKSCFDISSKNISDPNILFKMKALVDNSPSNQ